MSHNCKKLEEPCYLPSQNNFSMCGRYSLVASPGKFRQDYGIEAPKELVPRYNIAPGQKSWVITNDQPDKLQLLEWGLIPHWSRDGNSRGRLFNARREGISAKPSFRIPIRRHRCLVPADSFYEWRKEGNSKVPYRLLLKNEHLMMIAGVFDHWTDGRQEIKSFSIITTGANREVSALHERMPVILLKREEQRAWISALELEDALELLKTPPDGSLIYYRVPTSVNSAGNDTPDIHREVPEPPSLF